MSSAVQRSIWSAEMNRRAIAPIIAASGGYAQSPRNRGGRGGRAADSARPSSAGRERKLNSTTWWPGGQRDAAQRVVGAQERRRRAVDGDAPAGVPGVGEHQHARASRASASMTTRLRSATVTRAGSSAAVARRRRRAARASRMTSLRGSRCTSALACAASSASTVAWYTTKRARQHVRVLVDARAADPRPARARACGGAPGRRTEALDPLRRRRAHADEPAHVRADRPAACRSA